MNYFTDINLIEEAIRYKINECSECWTMQHELYELLKSFYIKNNKVFDEIMMAESMLSYSKNFTYDVVQGYISNQKWNTAVGIILPALKGIDNERILEALNISLIDCYEKLTQYDKGLEVATELFKRYPKKHAYYLKARNFADKIKRLDYFVKEMTAFAKTCDGYYSTEILLRILSSDGCINDMINFAINTDGYRRHDYMKYTFKSLIYRALRGRDRENIPVVLKELIGGLEHDKIPGITDMVDGFQSLESERDLLQSAITILKDIIQFHIAAAQRTRYARAAYYCSLVQGIYIFLNEKEEFEYYYGTILVGNKRRPALRDEMKKVIFTSNAI